MTDQGPIVIHERAKKNAEHIEAANNDVLALRAELARLREVALDILGDYESAQSDCLGRAGGIRVDAKAALKAEIEKKRLRIYAPN